MKIDDIYRKMPTDEDRKSLVEVNAELEYLANDIGADYDKIFEISRRVFHKEQHLNEFFKQHSKDFNLVCPLDRIFKAFYDGVFHKKTDKELDDLVRDLIVNFFPQWMWENVEYHNIVICGYDVSLLIIQFTYKMDTEIALFDIEVPNPAKIETGRIFQQNFQAISLHSSVKTYKTQAYVSRNWNLDTSYINRELVAEGYLNSSISNGISKWVMRNYVAHES